MKILIKFSLLISFFTLLMTACKKDDDNGVDTTAPNLNIHYPEKDESIQSGTKMYFSATFTDDTELGRYSIDIHEAFDGHDHGKNYEPFRFELLNQALSGTEHFIDMDIDIPEETVPGKYHLTVYVTDQAGNSLNINGANSKTIEFYIETDGFTPVFNILSPVQEQKFNLNDNINITGTIKGFIEIEEIEIKIIHIVSGEVVWEWEEDHLDVETYDLNKTVIVAASWPSGKYEIKVKVELENGRHYYAEPNLEIIVE